jgi:PAS domain S-box-containing protein
MINTQIMVVEDEGIIALEIKEGLEKLGYHVSHIASSGEDAIKKVLSEPPDLVLMDIRLEGKMDGIEAACHFKENYSIPVIYLTAHSDEQTLTRAQKTESYGYLLKPVEDRALDAAIKMALYKAEKEREIIFHSKWSNNVLRSIGDGIIVSDIKGRIKFLNPAAEKLLGWRQEEIEGKNISSVFAFEEVDKQPFSEAILNGNINNMFNQKLKIKSGGIIKVDYTTAPLKNSMDLIIGLVIEFKQCKIENGSIKSIVELQKSVSMQKNLLPKNGSSIRDIRADWIFNPSKFGSGDMFNVFKLGKFHVGFYMIDVMGHGFSAAVISTALHKLLTPGIGGILRRNKNEEENTPKRRRSDFLPSIISPARVLEELNRRFYMEKKEQHFFTAVYGVINVHTGHTIISRAGHPYPVYQDLSGNTNQLKTRGHALGIMPELKCEEYEFNFKIGCRLFVYTDGLLENINRYSESFTSKQLINFINEHRNNKQQDLINNLDTMLTDLSCNIQCVDDVVFLALERE